MVVSLGVLLELRILTKFLGHLEVYVVRLWASRWGSVADLSARHRAHDLAHRHCH